MRPAKVPERGNPDAVIAHLGANPMPIATLGAVLSVLLLCLSGWLAWSLHRTAAAEESLATLQGTIRRIAARDEVMTRFIRMAAVTGEPEWWMQYQDLKPGMDRLIEDVVDIGARAAEGSAALRLREAYRPLKVVEDEVFMLVRQGDRAAALALLSSGRYHRQEQRFSEAIRELATNAEGLLEAQRGGVHRQMRLIGMIALAIILALLTIWLLVLKLLRGYIRARDGAEAELARAQASLGALIDTSPNGVFVKDDEGRYRLVNRAISEFLGAAPEDIVGSTDEDLGFPPSDAERFRLVDREVIHTGQSRSLLAEPVTHPVTGETRWFEVRKVPLPSANRSVQVLGILTDVTEQVGDREALRKTRDALQALIDASPLAISGVDIEGKVTLWNPAAERMFGWSREEVLGRPNPVVPKEKSDEFRALHVRVLKGEAIVGVDLRQQRKNGTLMDVRLSTAPLHDARGEICGMMALFEDRTQRRELEERERQLFRVEAARVEAEAARMRITRILESISDGFVALDDACRFTYVNQKAEELLGRKREDLIGKDLWEEYPDLDRAGFSAPIHRSLDERVPVKFEAYYEPLGRWYAVHASASIEGVSLYFHDITRRKQAEEALHHSEGRLRLMMESVKDYAIILLDPAGQVVEWNPGAERVKGYTEEEIFGRHISIFYSEADQADGKPQRMLDVAAREGHSEDEGWRVRKDGSLFWASVVITALRDESGDLVGFAKITRDLSERHRVEEENRRKAEMVKLLQIAAVAANEATSVEEAFRIALEQVCAYTGWAGGQVFFVSDAGTELIASDLWYTVDPERGEQLRSLRESLQFRPGVGLPGQVFGRRRPIWIADVTQDPTFSRAEAARRAGFRTGIGFPVLAGQEVVAVLEFFSEAALTRDDLLLSTMESMGAQLGRVVERKRAEEAIQRAKEAAQQASRAKSEFLSRMSHELRTPMNAILGFGQLLELEVEREEDRESVQQILRAGRHLLGLIDEVLDLAKIEAERLTLSLEPVYLPALLRDAVDLMRSQASHHDVRMYIREGYSERYVRADQQRLRQVILNLLSNAIKYNRKAGAVTISCEPRPEGLLRISVRDEGQGIMPDKLERLFIPFERLGAEHTGVQGTGLGLSLTRGLVKAMGGEIGVASEPGEGSTFWIELPIVDAPEPVADPESGLALAMAAEPASKRRTVLYIEDNLSNLRLVERVFAPHPHIRLMPAMQGRLGLELAREHRPDLILLDLHLPDIGGDEVLHELQRDPDLRGIPVVIISADATVGRIERLRSAGARDYVTKPFDLKRILEVVQQVLREKEEDG